MTTLPITSDRLSDYLRSHLIDPSLLRGDSFEAFMLDRQSQLLALIEKATGKTAYKGAVQEEGEDAEAELRIEASALPRPASYNLPDMPMSGSTARSGSFHVV